MKDNQGNRRYNISMADIKICNQIKENVLDCLTSNWISSGRYVERCQETLTTILGARATLCSSGTAGLHAALQCANLPKNSKVIVPACTFGATANAVRLAGHRPVIVDIDVSDGCLSLEDLQSLDSDDIRAVVYVHLFGVTSVSFGSVVEMCQQKGWVLIEDAAEAFGGKFDGKYLGTFGEAGVYSFYANKTISCGEGGCIVGSNALTDRVKSFISHGMRSNQRYYHREIGANYRLTDLQGAVLLPQLDTISEIVESRKYLFDRLKDTVAKFSGEFVVVNNPRSELVSASYWLIAIRCLSFSRTKMLRLRSAFEQKGIETRPIFPPLHLQSAFEDCEYFGNKGASEELFRRGFCLPVLSTLEEEQINVYTRLVERTLGEACGRI